MGHASWGVTGSVQCVTLQVAHGVLIAVFEELIKLRAVALELTAFVKNFSEGFLYDNNVFANTDLAANFFLNIGRCRQMVGVHVGFNNPL